MATRRKSGIHINPANRGKLRASTKKTKKGTIKVSELQAKKRSKDPAVRKRATFALNARKFKHKGGKKK